jgi:hypothetical protein
MRAIPPILLGAVLLLLYALTPSRGLIAGRYVLTQSDLDGFTEFMSGGGAACPFGGIPSPRDELACQESAGSSFVTNAAYAEGSTSWEDALEASRSVPFVATHHGTFEVNENVMVFSNPEVAHEYYLLFTDSNDLSRYSSWQIVPSPAFGDESVTTRSVTEWPYPPVKAPLLVTKWRRGRVITTLGTYGSPDRNAGLILRLASIIDQRIQQQGQ